MGNLSSEKQLESAAEKYVAAWIKLSAEQLRPILTDKVSLFEPGLDKEEDKDEFIEVHKIWFERIASSSISGVLTSKENEKPIAGTELVISEISISSENNENIMLWARFIDNGEFHQASVHVYEAIKLALQLNIEGEEQIPHITLGQIIPTTNKYDLSINYPELDFDLLVDSLELNETNQNEQRIVYEKLLAIKLD